MAYTEKVSVCGTTLSFLLYECLNSSNTQEGFLIGDVTSEVTTHISDLNSDTTRLDTQIVLRAVLPLPTIAMFYSNSGRILDDTLKGLLGNTASEIVGWYKYRRNCSIKPTFRDKLITKGLQKYFENFHNNKHFVSCNISSKISISGSTHTLIYRFGKINCMNMYEYIEDVTANLGEKISSYKKSDKRMPNGVFNKIVQDSNVESNNTNEAIKLIQEAVDIRLVNEAKLAAKTECTIRELESEIKQLVTILSDQHSLQLQSAYDKLVEEKFVNTDVEMAKACVNAINEISETNNIDIDFLSEIVQSPEDGDSTVDIIDDIPSPITPTNKPIINYASALKKNNANASTASCISNITSNDLITFDNDDTCKKKQDPVPVNDDFKILGESSPEY